MDKFENLLTYLASYDTLIAKYSSITTIDEHLQHGELYYQVQQ